MKNTLNRILCWDKKLIESEENLELIQHKPQKKNVALLCDDEWEGVHNTYGCTVKVGETIRLYYRASTSKLILSDNAPCSDDRGTNVICVAESKDGITFKKPNVGLYEYNGSTYNNIVFSRTKEIDNFSVFYDKNPACPAEEKFKALCSEYADGKAFLRCYLSADGYNFKEGETLHLYGSFDSFNLAFWDEETEQYFLYFRAFHPVGHPEIPQHDIFKSDDIRDIRLATSKHFKEFTTHGCISFEEGQEEIPLYTNQIEKYYRAKSTFIGFPVRYMDRKDEYESFEDMPLADQRKKTVEKYGRGGTAITDCLFMTSKDGFTFDRRDEAFLTPGPEGRNNWRYGNCYTVHGIVETEAEEEGAANEISIYVSENYRMKNANFYRYTLRLDGFYSWFGPYNGATVLTKPIEVTAGSLTVNFATSCAGAVQITLCDTDGAPIEGFQSKTFFGDSVDRRVRFEGDLSSLLGKQVRLKITLRDAHLYSFAFQ